MPYRHLRIDAEGGALRLTLDRPDVLNALSLELLEELADALRGPAAAPEVRAVLITGAGRAFCAGADLADTPVDADIGPLLERYYEPVVLGIRELRKPVIAGVNGVAAGAGLSLAAACDLRIVSSAAQFALGFTGIGLVMDAGCSHFLPRLIGVGRTMELALSNRRVGAEEALRIGLAERELPAEGFEAAVWAAVTDIARGPTLAYALVKGELAVTFDNDLAAQLGFEARSQAAAAQSHDAAEGVAAFRAKRAPAFRGG